MGHEIKMKSSLPPSLDPLSDNETIRELYMHHRVSECFLELYSVCQEGRVEVKRMNVDFDDGKSENSLFTCT